MNKVILTTICIAALGGASALAQNTTAEKAALERFAKFEQTGEFQRCINRNLIIRSTIVDDTRIMFKLKGGKDVLNTLSSECHNLGFERTFGYSASNNLLCAKDVITTRYGNCNLGQFESLEDKS